MLRKLLFILALGAAAAFVGACGGGDGDQDDGPTQAELEAQMQEEALVSVCAAAQDIEQRVGDLASLSILNVSLSEIEEDLGAIGADEEAGADEPGFGQLQALRGCRNIAGFSRRPAHRRRC